MKSLTNDCERRKQDLWWESREEDSKLGNWRTAADGAVLISNEGDKSFCSIVRSWKHNPQEKERSWECNSLGLLGSLPRLLTYGSLETYSLSGRKSHNPSLFNQLDLWVEGGDKKSGNNPVRSYPMILPGTGKRRDGSAQALMLMNLFIISRCGWGTYTFRKLLRYFWRI